MSVNFNNQVELWGEFYERLFDKKPNHSCTEQIAACLTSAYRGIHKDNWSDFENFMETGEVNSSIVTFLERFGGLLAISHTMSKDDAQKFAFLAEELSELYRDLARVATTDTERKLFFAQKYAECNTTADDIKGYLVYLN